MAIGSRNLTSRLSGLPPSVVVVVALVVAITIDVVVVVVVAKSISVDVVVVVVASTSVDVVVVSVVVVVAAGVTVEVVVEGPTFNKLLQNEVAGALSRTEQTGCYRHLCIHR